MNQDDMLEENVDKLLAGGSPRLHLPEAQRARILDSLKQSNEGKPAMSSTTSPLVAAAVLLVAGAGLAAFFGLRGGEPTAAQVLEHADALNANGDVDRAFEEYVRVYDWTGAGKATEEQRFKAAVESVKCQIALGQHAEAVERYGAMFDAFPVRMGASDSYKATLSVFGSLVRERAAEATAVSLMRIASLRHPEHTEKFATQVTQFMADKEMSDEFKELQSLGYIGGND